jgi:hypothetical protein
VCRSVTLESREADKWNEETHEASHKCGMCNGGIVGRLIEHRLLPTVTTSDREQILKEIVKNLVDLGCSFEI